MASQQPKSHIVPKVYLKNFTNLNGKLFKLRKNIDKHPKPKEIHPSGVCYQEGFYTFNAAYSMEGYTVDEVNILENYGFKYENKLGKLISKIIDSSQLIPMQDAWEFSLMLFDIKARNQYMREHSYSKQNIDKAIDNLLVDHQQNREHLEEKLRAQGSSYQRLIELIEELRKEWTEDEKFSKELHNRSLVENQLSPSLVRRLVFNKLAKGSWTILETTLNHQFITSDNPGYCHDEYNNIYNTRFIGRLAFFFPLTPYYALAILMEGDQIEPLPTLKAISHQLAAVELVKAINQTTWQLANREVYAAHENPLLQTWATINSRLTI